MDYSNTRRDNVFRFQTEDECQEAVNALPGQIAVYGPGAQVLGILDMGMDVVSQRWPFTFPPNLCAFLVAHMAVGMCGCVSTRPSCTPADWMTTAGIPMAH